MIEFMDLIKANFKQEKFNAKFNGVSEVKKFIY